MKTILATTIVIILFGIGVFIFYKKGNEVAQETNNELKLEDSSGASPSVTPAESKYQMDNALQIQDLRVGTGAEAKSGFAVLVNYVGTLQNGTKFDSSYDRGQPFQFILGRGEVIRGWDIGVVGMKVGGKRKLVIPPQLAYGEQGIGPIPGNATLIFEVELLAVQDLTKTK